MEQIGFYLLLAGIWSCVLLAAAFLRLYLIDQRKENDMPEMLETVAAVPNKIIKAADSVLETGMKEKFEVSFTVFGRKIGVSVEVSLLSKEPGR